MTHNKLKTILEKLGYETYTQTMEDEYHFTDCIRGVDNSRITLFDTFLTITLHYENLNEEGIINEILAILERKKNEMGNN